MTNTTTPTISSVVEKDACCPESHDWPHRYRIVLCSLTVMYSLWFLYKFGTASLWLDETLTAWVTNGDFWTCTDRALEFQGQSPVYFILIWWVRQWFGNSELVLRSVSILSMIGAVVTVYAILRELNLKKDAWIAALVTLLAMLSDFHVGLIARPYTLAIFVSLISFYSLLRWLNNKSWVNWGVYVAASSVTIMVHYLFGTMVGFHFLVVIVLTKCNFNRVRDFILSWVFIGVILLPFLPHLLAVSEKSKRYEISLPPTALTTALEIFWSSGILQILVVTLAFGFIRPRMRISAIPKPAGWIGISWWVVGPLSIFLLYQILGMSLNIPRYYSWRVPALGIMVVVALHAISPHRFVALPAIIFLAFAMPVMLDTDRTGWREAIKWAEQHTDSNSHSVVYSGLIETADKEWISQERYQSYMVAPMQHYQWKREISILPILIPRSTKLFEERLQDLFERHDHLIFFMRLIPEAGTDVRQRALTAGYKIDSAQRFGLVEVVVISRDDSGT